MRARTRQVVWSKGFWIHRLRWTSLLPFYQIVVPNIENSRSFSNWRITVNKRTTAPIPTARRKGKYLNRNRMWKNESILPQSPTRWKWCTAFHSSKPPLVCPAASVPICAWMNILNVEINLESPASLLHFTSLTMPLRTLQSVEFSYSVRPGCTRRYYLVCASTQIHSNIQWMWTNPIGPRRKNNRAKWIESCDLAWWTRTLYSSPSQSNFSSW